MRPRKGGARAVLPLPPILCWRQRSQRARNLPRETGVPLCVTPQNLLMTNTVIPTQGRGVRTRWTPVVLCQKLLCSGRHGHLEDGVWGRELFPSDRRKDRTLGAAQRREAPRRFLSSAVSFTRGPDAGGAPWSSVSVSVASRTPVASAPAWLSRAGQCVALGSAEAGDLLRLRENARRTSHASSCPGSAACGCVWVRVDACGCVWVRVGVSQTGTQPQLRTISAPVLPRDASQ